MRTAPLLTLAVAIFFIGVNFSRAAQENVAESPTFGGKYSELKPEQKRLASDWFQRLSQVFNEPVPPEQGYDNLPLSVRTTFEAVTHALLHTSLTDTSGTSLGKSALDVVRRVDSIAGKREGERGDKQFRIYVELAPGALQSLAKSQEFGRGPDNTVYHKGYPVCYRSRGGTPSIQVSATKDGKLADIDVDYRSSSIPIFLINGHLSSSNSDVRAGNNYQRHNLRWAGLANWWRTLMGLPLIERPSLVQETEEGIIPTTPRIKPNSKPAEAIHDFLQSWLVEQHPHEAVAYIAESAFPCMELERGRPLDRGMAKFRMLRGLQAINERIGKVKDLSEASVGIHVYGPRARVIKQPYQAQFVLYDVREDLAELFKCGNKLSPENLSLKATRSHKFGRYVGAVFNLKASRESGETIATLWEKQNKYWKLISYDVEPDFGALRMAAAAPPAKAPTLAYMKGDEDLIHAARRFYANWFIRGNVEAAFQFLSPQSYPCVNLYRSEDAPDAKTPDAEAQALRAAMERVAKAAGPVKKLTDAIIAPEPSHPDLKLVGHPDSKAFVIASVPDYMAAAAGCANRKPGEDLAFTAPPERTTYGNYYATGFKLAKQVEDSSVLWTVWGKDGDKWRILSYALLTP